MAADVSGGHGPSDPSLWNIVATALGVLGAPVLLQKLLEHFFGHKKADAESELMHAQARKTESEVDELAASRMGEFEKAVNDRVKAVLDSWERQVTLLTDRIQAQQDEIQGLRREVVELRKALDATTRELHAARVTSGFGV
jgi:predicted  nucleic acid-binding Zn-ribbon protein